MCIEGGKKGLCARSILKVGVGLNRSPKMAKKVIDGLDCVRKKGDFFYRFFMFPMVE